MMVKSVIVYIFEKQSVITRRGAFNFKGCFYEMVDDLERGNICLPVCWLRDAVYKRA